MKGLLLNITATILILLAILNGSAFTAFVGLLVGVFNIMIIKNEPVTTS